MPDRNDQPRRERRGRRPGASGTREAIETAARRQFAELGFDRTSLRRIALEAGVDPALVTHYFGSKSQLFATVAELPVDPGLIRALIVGDDPDTVGERLAAFVLTMLESPDPRARMLTILRAAVSEPDAAAMVRERLTEEILVPIAEQLGADQATYRGSLLMSQVVGLALARAVVGIEPLASMPAERVAADLAPTFQRYLTGPLSQP